jgi:hypothetical protein
MGFLSSLGVEELRRIFKAEINGDVLGKFLVLFEGQLNKEDLRKESCDFIVDLLRMFTECSRFELNLMFLKDSETKSCKRILEFLENSYEKKYSTCLNTDLLQSLKSCYK